MAKGPSRRAFAKIIGLSESGVRKAEKTGRIVLWPDGSVNEEASKKKLAATTDPARAKVRTDTAVRSAQVRTAGEAAPPPVKDEAEALDAVSLVRRVLEQGGVDAPGSVDFSMARTAESILKSRERELKMAERRKELVPIAKVRDHVQKAFIGYRQTMQRLSLRHAAAIAAELGVDSGRLEKLMERAIQSELEAMSAPVVLV